MEYTFLSAKFYNEHPQEDFPQMEQKDNRPYAHIYIKAYEQLFAIPLRSNIDHPHAFFTNKKEHCGVDYSKAVIITDKDYINIDEKVFIRPDEYKKLQGKDYKIKIQFERYIELYKQAKIDDTVPHRDKILEFSTLQYYEEYIYSSEEQIASTEEKE